MSITDPLVPLEAFALDPAVLHLNHGSFGAAPRAALAAQAAARNALEAATMRFMVRDWPGLIASTRVRVAAFVGCDPDVYNRLADYDRLAEALLARGVRGRAL